MPPINQSIANIEVREGQIITEEIIVPTPQVEDVIEGTYFSPGFSIDNVTYERFYRASFGSILEDKPIEKPKTEKEKYKELKDKLQGSDGKTFDKILKEYLNERDMILLRDILDKSHHLRTYHDMRCFIQEYIYANQ